MGIDRLPEQPSPMADKLFEKQQDLIAILERLESKYPSSQVWLQKIRSVLYDLLLENSIRMLRNKEEELATLDMQPSIGEFRVAEYIEGRLKIAQEDLMEFVSYKMEAPVDNPGAIGEASRVR